jgi:FMN-dependent NADH-azoreductase
MTDEDIQNMMAEDQGVFIENPMSNLHVDAELPNYTEDLDIEDKLDLNEEYDI